MRNRVALLASLITVMFAAPLSAQTIYNWNNTTNDWTTTSGWDPNGVPGGNAGDYAQFTAPLGVTVNNPVLNSTQSFFQLNFGGTPPAGWSLTGTGGLTLTGSTGAGAAGSISQAGLVTRAGSGTTTINLGNGTATSLALSGATGTAGGSINVGSGSTLVFTGNTVATVSGTAPISIRGGTLVLDNSAGNPTSNRLTTANAIALNGGGSTLELRGASGGTTFSGITGALGAAGSGDTFLRLIQNGSESLTVNFASLSRVNTSGSHFFENIGSGFVGDSGKPTVTFTTAPTTRQGVLSTSAATTIPWAAVTNRSTATSADVTGRWANYNSGVVAATTTSFAGDFGGAVAGTNVLYNPTTAGTVNQTVVGNQLASVVFEPGVSGATYNVGTGNQLNTLAVMLSGTNDFSVSGGSLFSTGTAGTRSLAVVNPTTALLTNSNFAANSSPVTISGPGFVILNGTTNQVAFGTTQNFNLAGGVMRVTSTNFDLTPTAAPTLRFRGGVIEYDVSGANFTFSRPVGAAAGNVNWTSNAGFGASTNVGSGGFSAYAGTGDGNGNILTVNLFGDGRTLFWNDQASGTGVAQLFVTDGYALKFGSLRSNATVNFQNNIALDGSSSAENTNASNTVAFNRTREINVIRGVGNSADRTVLSGVISGTPTVDLVKTGTGLLELSALNTYQGNTFVRGGELLVSGELGNTNPTGNVVVSSGATLSGTGTIRQATGKQTVVLGGGTIRGDSGTGTGTLTTGNVTVLGGGNLFANLAASGTSSTLALSSNTLDLKSGSVLKLDDVAGFNSGTYNLATFANGDTLLVNGTATTNDQILGEFVVGSGNVNTRPVLIDPTALSGLTAGDTLTLKRSSNNLVLTFTPVPEPAFMLAVCGLAVGGVVGLWKLRRKAVAVPADETPAA